MSQTATIDIRVTTPKGTVNHSESYTLSPSRIRLIDFEVADSQTDYQVNFDIDVSQVKLFFVKSDQAVTIETNSGSSPDDTITLTATKLTHSWHANDAVDSFTLGTDVTALFVTNSSGSTAKVEVIVAEDQ